MAEAGARNGCALAQHPGIKSLKSITTTPSSPGASTWIRSIRSTSTRKECFLQVIVRDNNVDQALRVLKKKMQREGVFREMKRRRFYEKSSEGSNREQAEAIRRARKLARKRAEREGLIPAPRGKKVPGKPTRRGPFSVVSGIASAATGGNKGTAGDTLVSSLPSSRAGAKVGSLRR